MILRSQNKINVKFISSTIHCEDNYTRVFIFYWEKSKKFTDKQLWTEYNIGEILN